MNPKDFIQTYLSSINTINPLYLVTLILNWVLPIVLLYFVLRVFWNIHNIFVAPELYNLYQKNAQKLTSIQKQILVPLILVSGFILLLAVSQIGILVDRTTKFNFGFAMIIAFSVISLVDLVSRFNQFALTSSRLTLIREVAFLVFGVLVYTLTAFNRRLEIVEILAMLVYFGGYLLLTNFWSEISQFIYSKKLILEPRPISGVDNVFADLENDTRIIMENSSKQKFLFPQLKQNLPNSLFFLTLIIIQIISVSVAYFCLSYWSRVTGLSGTYVAVAIVFLLARKTKINFQNLTSIVHLQWFVWLVGVNLVAFVGLLFNISYPIAVTGFNFSSLFGLLIVTILIAIWILFPKKDLSISNKFFANLIFCLFLIYEILLFVSKIA